MWQVSGAVEDLRSHLFMSEELISVIDAAKQLGKRKGSVFKILKRLGIKSQKLRGPNARGQLISYITQEDFHLVGQEIHSSAEIGSDSLGMTEVEVGVFYIIQLEPEHDPGRCKLGFTSNITERLRAHRCSAPFSTVLKTWPCRSLWEQTVIDCVSADCEKLHTEVFRTESMDKVIEKCEQFFTLMPSLNDEVQCRVSISPGAN